MNIFELIKVNTRIAWLFILGRKIEISDFEKSYEDLASYYDDQWYVNLDAVTDEILLNINDMKPKRMLDLGCGTGSSTLKLRKMFPESYILGMDFSTNMLDFARKKLGSYKTMFFRDYLERGIKKLGNKQFDFITCCWSLGYATNKKVYKELNRIISDGGYLLILTNKRDTLRAVRAAMKYTMYKHYKSIQKLPLHKFPKDKQHILSMLGKNFKEVNYGEGDFSIDLTKKPSILDWLLRTGILAGYEFVLDLRRDKACRNTYEQFIKSNFKEVTHCYMWILLQKK